jgi:hypothetical protein
LIFFFIIKEDAIFNMVSTLILSIFDVLSLSDEIGYGMIYGYYLLIERRRYNSWNDFKDYEAFF